MTKSEKAVLVSKLQTAIGLLSQIEETLTKKKEK